MSATDELRQLLDERNVEWWKPYEPTASDERWTHWRSSDGALVTALEYGDGRVALSMVLAPEQAITATMASDEIEVLNNELYDHEKMNEHICDQLARVKGHLAEAHERNDKLRTLAGALLDCSRDGLYTDELPCQWCDLKSQEVCERMAKELGVIE